MSKVLSTLAPESIENPTIIERFVSLIPLPYPLAALFWSAVLPSGLGFDAIQYLTTGTTYLSLASLPNRLLNLLFPFYAFLMVHYMRLRVVALEAPIAARLSGGERDYHQAFGGMTQAAPVLLLAATSGTLLLAIYASLGILTAVPWLVAINAFVVYLDSLAFSTYIWEFATASLGLHKLGGSSLKLGSFLEDRLMGTRPMGNLALTLTIAYFGGLLLVYLLFSTFLPPTISSQIMGIAFLLLGVALFFLPLNKIHAKMLAEKRRLLRETGARYPSLNHDSSPHRENVTLDDVHRRLARLTDLQELEMLDKKIALLPTWPFDIQVVSRFITVVLSVTAVLLARLLTNILHL